MFFLMHPNPLRTPFRAFSSYKPSPLKAEDAELRKENAWLKDLKASKVQSLAGWEDVATKEDDWMYIHIIPHI